MIFFHKLIYFDIKFDHTLIVRKYIKNYGKLVLVFENKIKIESIPYRDNKPKQFIKIMAMYITILHQHCTISY